MFIKRLIKKSIYQVKHWLRESYWWVVRFVPQLRPLYETRDTQTPITFKHWFLHEVLGINRDVYWPVDPTSRVNGVKNIYAGVDTAPGYSPGCYIQAIGKVYIGDYTQIAPNVGIISANHNLYDSRKHEVEEVRLGKYCWVGMNAVILPGVILGDFTIVGACSLVSKSFPEGYCVIGGNPAKIIKYLDKENCREFKNKYEYNGYVKRENFDEFRRKYLNV
jgi:acetyltransferase-like isoleucine patch superfamily enzyme